MKLSREGAVVVILGIVDLITTLWFIHQHGAAEGNPLMRLFLAQGEAAFILAKIALCVGPVLFLEWARKFRPRLVRNGLRATAALYLIAYGLGSFGINKTPMLRLYAASEVATVGEGVDSGLGVGAGAQISGRVND